MHGQDRSDTVTITARERVVTEPLEVDILIQRLRDWVMEPAEEDNITEQAISYGYDLEEFKEVVSRRRAVSV